jgi:hypothetical protein
MDSAETFQVDVIFGSTSPGLQIALCQKWSFCQLKCQSPFSQTIGALITLDSVRLMYRLIIERSGFSLAKSAEHTLMVFHLF